MLGSFTSSPRHRLGAFCVLSDLTYDSLKDHRCSICTILAFLPLFPYHLPHFAWFSESLESAWAWEGLLEQDKQDRKGIFANPPAGKLTVPSVLLGHQTTSNGLLLSVSLPWSSCIQGMSFLRSWPQPECDVCMVSRKHMEQQISHIYPDDLELPLNSTSILMNAEKNQLFFSFFFPNCYWWYPRNRK